ncbi:MAG: class I SAM-dependent methyltransferase [Eubacteriales bacterium]|nr:class I SAM-dependent methyltransferase [Eubacteriales bacterium]
MKTIQEDVYKLDGIETTLLSTVAGRAISSKKGRWIHDPVSEELYERLSPYMEEKYNKRGLNGVALRCKLFDDWIRDFLSSAPDAVCIYAGAGLDPRFQRVDNGRLLWYNVDLKDAIGFRNHLLPESERERNIEGDVFDTGWLAEIKEGNRPVLIIMEGMLQYFTSEEVAKVLKNLADRFSGARIIIDILSDDFLVDEKMVKRMSPAGTTFQWGVHHPSEVTALDGRYRLKRHLRTSEVFKRQSLFMRIVASIPKVRRMCGFIAMYVVDKG